MVVSYLVSALAALLSGLAYTEFVVDQPVAGGAFNMVSSTFGELAGWCGGAPLSAACSLPSATHTDAQLLCGVSLCTHTVLLIAVGSFRTRVELQDDCTYHVGECARLQTPPCSVIPAQRSHAREHPHAWCAGEYGCNAQGGRMQHDPGVHTVGGRGRARLPRIWRYTPRLGPRRLAAACGAAAAGLLRAGAGAGAVRAAGGIYSRQRHFQLRRAPRRACMYRTLLWVRSIPLSCAAEDSHALAASKVNCAGLLTACTWHTYRHRRRACAVVTGMNVIVIAYIMCAGLPFGRLENLTPFAPFGVRGVFGAASVVFFAFIGFDTVACAAEEAWCPILACGSLHELLRSAGMHLSLVHMLPTTLQGTKPAAAIEVHLRPLIGNHSLH